jgi:myo-inositol-1(or 4)-monophosphatase
MNATPPAHSGALLDELLATATELALGAGRMVREGRALGLGDVDTKSSATDLVTKYDRAAEEYITGRLRVIRPHDGLIGEEGTDEAGTSGLQWLIDPIDGTTNFVYGMAYAVSVAVVDDHGSVAGAVYLPASDELFSAARGRGAHLNGAQIHCSTVSDPAVALVSTGFGYSAERRAGQGARVAALLPQVRDIRRLGAAAMDLSFLACGRIDAYYEQWLNPWDIGAGRLIATEAGATVGTFAGSPGEIDGLVAAAPDLFDALVAAIEASGTQP